MIQPSPSAFFGSLNSTSHSMPPQPRSFGPLYRVLITGFWLETGIFPAGGMYRRPGEADLEKLQFLPSRVSLQPTRWCRYQLISSGVTFSPQLLAISSLTVTPCFLATDAQSSLSIT